MNLAEVGKAHLMQRLRVMTALLAIMTAVGAEARIMNDSSVAAVVPRAPEAKFARTGAVDTTIRPLHGDAGRVAAKTAKRIPGLDVGLNRIIENDNRSRIARELGYRFLDDRIQVVAVTRMGFTEDVITWLSSRDARCMSSAGGRIQAFVPVDLLPEMSADSRISLVRKPHYPLPPQEPEETGGPKVFKESYRSEGVAAMNAHEWHSAGFRGQRVKIDVLSCGFYGYQGLLGAELPRSAKVQYKTISGFQSSNSYGSAA